MIQITQVSLDDIPGLSLLVQEYMIDFHNVPSPGVDAISHNLCKHLLLCPDIGLQFVAKVEEEFAGFATLYFTFSTIKMKRITTLNDLFVSSKHRGKKIGEHLFRHCREYTRTNDFAFMQWETDKGNYIAQSLYNKMEGHFRESLMYEINIQ